MTTILDPDCPATEIVALYHQRWGNETAFFELKSTTLGGRVLRSRTPVGVEQEIYALLVTYQAVNPLTKTRLLSRRGSPHTRNSIAWIRT